MLFPPHFISCVCVCVSLEPNRSCRQATIWVEATHPWCTSECTTSCWSTDLPVKGRGWDMMRHVLKNVRQCQEMWMWLLSPAKSISLQADIILSPSSLKQQKGTPWECVFLGDLCSCNGFVCSLQSHIYSVFPFFRIHPQKKTQQQTKNTKHKNKKCTPQGLEFVFF